MRHVQNDQLFVFGYQPEFLEKLGSQYAQSPMAVADIVANVGDVNILSTDRQELLESRFYRDVLEPFALTDMIWFPALRTGGRMASMHASRKDKAPHYQQLEIGLFKLLSPHVCRALTISDALDIRTLRSEMLEKTLDVLAAGVFLTARDGRVVYMNEAAERQVKAGTAIRILNNRLDPVDPAARAVLSKAIDEAARDDDDGDPASIRSPSPINGAGYIATLLPVAAWSARRHRGAVRGFRRDLHAGSARSADDARGGLCQASQADRRRIARPAGAGSRVGRQGGGRHARHQRAHRAHPFAAHVRENPHAAAGRPAAPVADSTPAVRAADRSAS